MTTAHIVDLDVTSSTEKYELPAHRLDSLRPGTHLGQSMDCSIGIPIYSGAFYDMLEILKKDGPRGHTQSTIEPFHEFDKNFLRAWYTDTLLQEFIPSYPEIQAKLEMGIRVLDVGCGTGLATQLLAKKFPESQFVGVDIAQSNVDEAKAEATRLGLKNVSYVCADGSGMPGDWASTFDHAFFFNMLHDTSRPDLLIDEVKRVLKKDGFMSIIEFDFGSKVGDNVGNTTAPLFYTISLFYCLPQAYQPEDSHGLGTLWGRERIQDFLKEKGLVLKSATKVPKINELHFLCHLA